MTIPLVDAIRDLVSRRDALARDIAEKIAIFDRLDAEVRQAEEALGVRDRQTEDRQPAEDGGGRLASAVATPAATPAPVPTITPAAAVQTCRLCGASYVRTSNRQRICPECRAKVPIGTNLEELLERKAKGIPVFQAWADRTCEVETCRKTYTPKNHKQKICDECRATFGPRGPGRINKGIRRAADRAASRRGRRSATPRLPLTETVPCAGPGARGVEPCPQGKTVSKTKQARGPLRCPDCHLENKRRMVRERLPELRKEQKTRLGKIDAAAPGGFEGRLQTWREEKRANVDRQSAGSCLDDRRPAGDDGGARTHRGGRRPSRRAPESGAGDGRADRRRGGAGLGRGFETQARSPRAARGPAEAPMSPEESRDQAPAEDREALEASESLDGFEGYPAPDDSLELDEEGALEETSPAPAPRRFFGRKKAALKDPRLRQVKETGYRRNADKRETVETGGSWWLGKDRDAFSKAAAERGEELKRSKSSNIIRTPLNFV